ARPGRATGAMARSELRERGADGDRVPRRHGADGAAVQRHGPPAGRSALDGVRGRHAALSRADVPWGGRGREPMSRPWPFMRPRSGWRWRLSGHACPAELSRHLTPARTYPEVRGHVFFAAREVTAGPAGAMARVVTGHYG